MVEGSPQLTELLRRFDPSDAEQSSVLLPLVYAELRRMAAGQLARERNGHTLEPTDLVHEAYLRLAGGLELGVEGRAHFFGIIARSMRQVLVDHARRREAEKRGGGWQRVSLDSQLLQEERGRIEVLDLEEALEHLSERDEVLGRLVELRFFGGLTVDEAAAVLGISPRKAAKDWSAARLWLARELGGARP